MANATLDILDQNGNVFPTDGSTIVFRQTPYDKSNSVQLEAKHAFHHSKRK
ncbi:MULTISPECIES: hypothetical protein [unclassified Duganella]|uniref:hypothetical protein n=1 Tax=unclassified Duganella TaxID=2636909 RepID=UPI001314A0B5|nr:MULTISPECIES: hypothetical protein [unclassified Duganella]